MLCVSLDEETDLALRLLLTVSPCSPILSPYQQLLESAHWNSGKIMEAE